MKAAARKWVVTTACAMSMALVSSWAFAADVTDADRTYRNFTREAASLGKGQIRVEIRGFSLHDEDHTVLNVSGFRLRSLYGGAASLTLPSAAVSVYTNDRDLRYTFNRNSDRWDASTCKRSRLQQ